MRKTNYSLITGASSGLGLAFAHEIASRSGNLALVSLPGENLSSIATHLSEQYQIDVEYFEIDLCKTDAHIQIADWIETKALQIHSLINNAGVGGSSPFETMRPEQIDRMIQLNIRATTLLTRQMLPLLKKQDHAYILNVASLASFSPIPFKAIYAASKGFIYAFSQALRFELAQTHVSVSVLNPGPIMTNQEVRERIACHGSVSKLSVVSPEKVAQTAIRGLYAGKDRIIPGYVNQVIGFFMRNLPTSVVKRAMAGVFAKEKRLHTPVLSKAIAIILIFFSTFFSLSAQHSTFDIFWRNQEVGELVTQEYVQGDSSHLYIKTDVEIPWVGKRLNFKLESLYVADQMHKSISTYYLDNKKKEDSRMQWMGLGYKRFRLDEPPLLLERRKVYYSISRLYVEEPTNRKTVYSERHQAFLDLKQMEPHCYEVSLPDEGKNRYYYQDGELVRIEAQEGWFTIRFERKENHLSKVQHSNSTVNSNR